MTAPSCSAHGRAYLCRVRLQLHQEVNLPTQTLLVCHEIAAGRIHCPPLISSLVCCFPGSKAFYVLLHEGREEERWPLSLLLLVGHPEPEDQRFKGPKGSEADLSALTFAGSRSAGTKAAQCGLCVTSCRQERDPFACPWRLDDISFKIKQTKPCELSESAITQRFEASR